MFGETPTKVTAEHPFSPPCMTVPWGNEVSEQFSALPDQTKQGLGLQDFAR